MYTNTGGRATLATYNSRLSFRKDPKFLDSDLFAELSNTDRKIYTLLRDRQDLSKKNHWVNKNGQIYLNYSRAELAHDAHVSEKTVTKGMGMLKAAGLIEEERLGHTHSNRIYIRDVDETVLACCCKKGQNGTGVPSEGEGQAPAIEGAAPYEPKIPQAKTQETDEEITVHETEISGLFCEEITVHEPNISGFICEEIPFHEPKFFPGPGTPEPPANPVNTAPVASLPPASQTESSQNNFSQTEVGRNFSPSRILESSPVQSSQIESSQTEPPRSKKLSFKIADGYAAAPGPDGLDGLDPSEKMAAPPPQSQNPQARPADQPPNWLPRPEGRGESRAELWDKYDRIIKGNINYSALRADRTIDIERVDEAVACMLDVIVSDETTVRVCQGDKPRETVKGMYLKIREHHIRRVLEKFKAQDQKITKVGAYLKTMIYNEMLENANSYTNEVQVGYADAAL